ncbi:MAG: hypothetical protein ACRDSP_00305 [Pseudonocardiaceae bacterium]
MTPKRLVSSWITATRAGLHICGGNVGIGGKVGLNESDAVADPVRIPNNRAWVEGDPVQFAAQNRAALAQGLGCGVVEAVTLGTAGDQAQQGVDGGLEPRKVEVQPAVELRGGPIAGWMSGKRAVDTAQGCSGGDC